MTYNDCQVLRLQGWVRVPGVKTHQDFLALAECLGQPVPSPTGELIKAIRPTARDNARPGTLSAAYGTSAFPFHTDTAFWPLPSRYVLLRAHGDLRRRTLVWPVTAMLWQGCRDLSAIAAQSIWRVPCGRSAPFYCSMRFRHRDRLGWRVDTTCMVPANSAARDLNNLIAPLLVDIEQGISVDWMDDTVLVLDNWAVLHSRGPAPCSESERIVERIYVR